ncbi:MAG: GspE/PulE family protein, partial [Chitinispirillaceae bacterium]
PDRKLLRDIPLELLKSRQFYPIEQTDTHLHIAIADPLDFETVLSLEAVTGRLISITITPPTALIKLREQVFGNDSMFKETVGRISREFEAHLQKDTGNLSLEEIRKRTESEPVVRLVSAIFDEAIRQRASDVHIEPMEDGALVRFRVDGMLHHYMDLTHWMYVPATSRVKILADLDIAEKRVPQDGRIRYDQDGKQYDFRVSTLPTHHGEKTVVRILKHDQTLLELGNIGLSSQGLGILSGIIEKPQGMLFVTGPTGSGKSSTLFACLNRIKGKAINITTIENPIEYKLNGINQVQVNEKAGVTFARTLRSILRQDPDVILVGEIRDRETAEIAIQASQTGHLVLSTLHTNDSISAVTRLQDLGIPNFLISSSLLGILAQRLVRVLCPQCRYQTEADEQTRQKWDALMGGISLPQTWAARGCEHCANSGFRGRTGIFEIFTINDTLRTLISDNVSESKLRHAARDSGMISMIENGVEKVANGITTPEELLRVVVVDELALPQQHTEQRKQ